MKVPWQKERSTGGETAVQLRSGGRSTFGRLESYVPLLDGETALYREVREAVHAATSGRSRACSAFCARYRWAEGRGASTPFWTVTSIRF